MQRTIQVAVIVTAAAFIVSFVACQMPLKRTEAAGARWWKGNLHTHSLWSDGDEYPEMIVKWYLRQGYHFLVLSDHNILSVGDKWIPIPSTKRGQQAFSNYQRRFGLRWVETREREGKREVRLKTLEEFRGQFEKPDHFLMLQGEEITDRFESKPIHVNATNLLDLVSPQGGGSAREVMQNNVNAVLAQRKRTNQPMFPHIAHPNFGWAITAEDLMELEGERFFEIYNGHPQIRNYGDRKHISVERMWDIVLTRRLAELGRDVMYGVAVDDAHDYGEFRVSKSNPGRAWVMVRAPQLTPKSIITAMEAGDFYASTGVCLRDIQADGQQLAIHIEPERHVRYTTQFIGTRKNYDRRTEPVLGDDGKPMAVTRQYSNDIGMVLAEAEGASPVYHFRGDELYVRAKIISSKLKANPYRAGEMEVAWTQPVVRKLP